MTESVCKFHEGAIHLIGALAGPINVSTLPPLGPKVTVNFRRVTNINSAGVSRLLEFVFWLNKSELTFVECPTEIIHVFVMLPALLGTEDRPARVASFFTPYACDGCNEDVALLLQAAEIVERADGTMQFPPRKCPRCSKAMRHDEQMEEQAADLKQAGSFFPTLAG